MLRQEIVGHMEKFIMKHWAFDYFDGFMTWIYEGDNEFINRFDKFINVHLLSKILFKKRVYDSNLTVL